MALTIQERLKDLRVERGLMLEQLAEQTHLSKSALGSYESDEYKDISYYALIKLAKFYGVTADYLLGLTEIKNHPTMAVDLLQTKLHSLLPLDGRRQAEFNTNRLQIGFCEITHITERKKKMKILEVTNRTPNLINRLLEVWEGSVRATHLFLSDTEIRRIKEYVPQALNGIAHLMIAEDDTDCPVAFMGIEDGTLEMLFISPAERGKGLGKRLIQFGIENYAVERLAVNEQNPQAKGFYEHMGFHVYKRTDLDEQGNFYPLLYMSLSGVD